MSPNRLPCAGPPPRATGEVAMAVAGAGSSTAANSPEGRAMLERLQLACDAAQVGVWDLDLVTNRLTCDARMLALCGLSPATFDGTIGQWRARLHPEDLPRIDREYCEALHHGAGFTTSYRVLRPDRDECELHARAAVKRNGSGRAVRVVAVHWDVTSERRARAEIEFARDQAEDLNRQLEEALARAHRLAQEAAAATVAKSEFLANMSHEIRTPLNAILGMSGLLLETTLGKDQREFAETIRSSGDGLLALINDILDYSKIESGKLEIEHRPYDLRECVESSVDLLAGRAAEKNLDLVYAIDPSVPESIVGDFVRLRQVIVNLLSNAVKFTARGDVCLALTTMPAVDPGRVRVRCAVRDTGIGIPADRLDRLFKTFSQVDASTTRQYGGTGLGLAISKRIIELMGGRIWVESTPGKGSTFSFEIEAAAALTPPRPFAAGRVPAFAGRRVLVVDGNATSCGVVCDQARVWGLEAAAAANLGDATTALRDLPFDLALVDHKLAAAHAGGLAALHRARAGATVPLVLLTLPGQPRPAGDAPVAATINKPVKTAALYDVIARITEGRSARPAKLTDAVANLGAERPLAILLAEDNPVNQRVAVLMLQRLGYRADIASNGREAVAAAVRQPYDLVLMDVQMPDMDGLQAAAEICARLGGERRPRIVAMTASASTSDRDLCLKAGMSDFLTKPVRADDLRRALEQTPGRRGV